MNRSTEILQCKLPVSELRVPSCSVPVPRYSKPDRSTSFIQPNVRWRLSQPRIIRQEAVGAVGSAIVTI
jgi:hypothetical protein